jgi:3-oxoacyl-[acyl-carrier-protein] synthase-3
VIRAAVAGWGIAVPEGCFTNADLEARIDTTDRWIVERTGIRERRAAGPTETTATLSVTAGNSAIKSAGLTPGDLSMVIVATCTPDQPIPETSAYVAEGLGVRCGAFDVGAACAGFGYALVVGASIITAAPDSGPVLVVGAETLTRIVDPMDRATVILFGDGAAAVVLAPSAGGPDGPGLLSWDMGSDGSAASLIEVKAGGSRRPISAEAIAAGEHWMSMDGPEVFRRAVRVVVDSSKAALDRAGLGPEQIDWFVPHQANARIISAAASRLDIPPERCVVNIDRYGNTSAASIPLALAEAAEDGRLTDGDLVLLSGFGAGMTWTSAVLRWGRPVGQGD